MIWKISLSVVACLIAGSAAAQGRAPNQPGVFDYYVLSLSWSPSFCGTGRSGDRELQCGSRPYAFVVHGLWPQYDKGFPEACQVPLPQLDRRIVDSMLDMMPSRTLVFHEWDAHGTCSGLSQRDYFDAVRKARAAVTIPSEYIQPQAPLTVTPRDVIESFVKANAGLPRGGIEIDCDRTRLREVRICLSRDLHFRACTDNRNACRADKVVMPPARGR